MTPLATKIMALITPEITPEAAELLRQAADAERKKDEAHHCHRCGCRLYGTEAVLYGIDASEAANGIPVTCGLCRDDILNGR